MTEFEFIASVVAHWQEAQDHHVRVSVMNSIHTEKSV